MKIAVYSLTYWYSKAEAESKGDELYRWVRSMRYSINPDYMWLVSGTYSDPSFNPVYIPLINTGIAKTHGNDFQYWSYANLAHTFGLYHALLNTDCDLCAQFSTDSVINVDYTPILEEFMRRDELVCAPSWNNVIEDAAIFYKREGMLKYISSRLRPILVEPGAVPAPMFTEVEALEIFKDTWWNPWPHIKSMRQEYGFEQYGIPMWPSSKVIEEDWPMVIRPAPDIIQRNTEIWQRY